MSDNTLPPGTEHISDFLQRQEEEIHAGLVVAIEFRLPCGHTICQAIRQEKMVHRTEVYEAMKEAGDKLGFWLTRHGIPKHQCDQVSDVNPNGEAGITH